MEINVLRPQKLFRYSEYKWLRHSLEQGDFRLTPATTYRDLQGDIARQDDELVRTSTSEGSDVTITMLRDAQNIRPIGPVTYRSEISTNYFTLCFSSVWDIELFEDFQGSDSCLVIRDVHEFSERILNAVEALLPNWAGLDGPVEYGARSALGVAFSKAEKYYPQHEWRFAWLPEKSKRGMTPLSIRIGSIEDIASVVYRPK